ncbi:MAG: DUF21 domain-containing protein, partial [Planctomycetota bacterium]|nr:DUF21 domain-containing protein [Planctomycetota bacterium]
ASLLIGNNIADDLAVHAAVMLVAATGMPNSEFVAILILTPMMFFAGEMWPKQFMLANPNRLIWFSAPLFVVRLILWPLAKPIAIIVNKLDAEDGDSALRRNQFVALLHDSQRQASGEAQVMTAAIRAIESKGKGLEQYLRYELPQIKPDCSIDSARSKLSTQPDAKAIVFREQGPPSILYASRLVDCSPDTSLQSLTLPLINISPDNYLSSAVRHMQIYGVAHAWVEKKNHRAGLLDLEYALASLLSS